MKKIIILLFILFYVNSFSDEQMIRIEKRYYVKVRLGNFKIYEGEVDCYFERNKELTKFKVGSMKRKGYHVELREVGDLKGD